MNIGQRIKYCYEKYRGLPNNAPIVRNNTEQDAFVIVVFEIIYKDLFSSEINAENINILSKYIVAPPDGGIDIFVEKEDGDEYTYDIIQVKYSGLAEQDISQCFANMKRTIELYLKSPKNVTQNLRSVISSTNFDSTALKNCTYYVVHIGKVNYCKGTDSSERIVTINDLETLRNNQQNCVPEEKIKSDKFNNFILYENKIRNDEKKPENAEEEAYLCNLNGYDLALLNNKYASTEVGRNILFGQNLRDSLQDKKSKTYNAMKQTIDEEPEKFWYYNNGITIIASEFDTESVDKSKDGDTVILRKFSIINGAQTTSSLGLYLKDALESDEKEKEFKINQLKKVFVLTRILVINNPGTEENIAIYNNMQNPITSRDMVANREEQKKLHQWLITGEKPYIFVEIRRGTSPQSKKQLKKHQETNNEFLAQLAFAAFYRQPYVAKDKKKTLFNNDYTQKEYTINADYHKIFNYSVKIDECGILFRKSKEEINELLFLAYLHKLSKNFLKRSYNASIDTFQDKLDSAKDEEEEKYQQQIILYKSLISINNICLFYNLALYYELKDQFSEADKDKYFNYKEFYDNKDYKNNMIEEFADKFLSKTIEIIKDKSEGSMNVNNWIRTVKNQDLFLKTVRNNIGVKMEYKRNFMEFIDRFKL